MNVDENVKTVIVALVLIIVISAAIIWAKFQWDLCMKYIGDQWYCIAHIG
jgi:hypothetical protein